MAKQRVCVECEDDQEAGVIETDEMQFGWDCGVCGESACERHGRQYDRGWEHETCHEMPDYNSIERD